MPTVRIEDGILWYEETTTFRSYAQLILMELADLYGFPPPNIPELLYQKTQQPAPGRKTLLEEVCGDLTAVEV